MTNICGCGEEIVPPTPENSITMAGGWCAPAEALYDLPQLPDMCGDCKARMLVMMEIGIDPGPKGEYLRVKRGGITYERKS